MGEFIFKAVLYISLITVLTVLCFGTDSKLLFKKTSQLNLNNKHQRIARVLKGAIIIFFCYTLLTFAAKEGFYAIAGDGKGPRFAATIYNNKFIGILKEYNDLINSVITTFVSIFTYIAYLIRSYTP